MALLWKRAVPDVLRGTRGCPQTGLDATPSPMNETDLPCSNCGTDPVERTVYAQELPVATDWHGHVQVAECPRCDARYYPKRALSKLTEPSALSPAPGGS